MKKIIFTFILLIVFILSSSLLLLSLSGVETNKFNNFISKKINETNDNIDIKLTTIKFKFDIKEVGLFLETNDSIINYRNIIIPSKNIRVYIDFKSLLKVDPKIKKINIIFNKLKAEQLKGISATLKPSNFTSFVNNQIKQGEIDADLEIYLNDDNLLDDFIARGSVSNLDAKIFKKLSIKKTNFNFFFDKSDILLKNISSESGPIKIEDGDLKVKLSSTISLESNFKTNLKYHNKFKNYENLLKDINVVSGLTSLEAELNNSFFIDFDRTYKVKKYKIKSNGKIIKAKINFIEPLENLLLNEKITQLTLINSKFETNISAKQHSTNISGDYILNKESKPLSFNLENNMNGELLDLKLNVDYKNSFALESINYEKPVNLIANIFVHLNKQKNNLEIKEISFKEEDNLIFAEDIKLNDNKFISFNKISVKTEKAGVKNNDFSIFYKKKVLIKGTHFDATNLPKILNRKTETNLLSHISKDIEIDFSNIKAPLSENLKNFKLIGTIEKGRFVKISSKGDFGGKNFLDITMKQDKQSQKKYLEIYSDLTRPLLTEYNFFKGLSGGKLLFSSVIDKNNSTSKLKIENFKLINAPGMIKLLSLADLGGLADLAKGDGLSFDVLEINMEKNKDYLKLNEILALGPSISVLMEGYQDPTTTSLRGTLVPAKTLNRMISKIPLLGDIVIPKEVGEGLFGISFKLKGPPGKIKTTINPIRTITPRFIQKIIDRNKKSK
jgi:hypothetical protein